MYTEDVELKNRLTSRYLRTSVDKSAGGEGGFGGRYWALTAAAAAQSITTTVNRIECVMSSGLTQMTYDEEESRS